MLDGLFKFAARAMSHKTGRGAVALFAASMFGDNLPGVAGVVSEAILNPQIVTPLGILAIYMRDRQAKIDRGES